MKQCTQRYSIRDIVLPNNNKPYLERNLRPSFLPLEAHCSDSLAFVLKGEGASEGTITRARHIFHGIQTFRQRAKSYGEEGREKQAQAYAHSALELEAHLRLFLHDAFPPSDD